MSNQEASPTPPPAGTPAVVSEQQQGASRKNDNSNPQQGTNGALPTAQVEPRNRAPIVPMASAQGDNHKLFVGGLPTDVTGDEFKTFFQQFGSVSDSVVMFDRLTHRSRGFGFVTFDDPQVCSSLLLKTVDEDSPPEETSGPRVGRLQMRNKTIEIKAAAPKDSTTLPQRRYHGSHENRRHFHRNIVPPHFDPNMYMLYPHQVPVGVPSGGFPPVPDPYYYYDAPMMQVYPPVWSYQPPPPYGYMPYPFGPSPPPMEQMAPYGNSASAMQHMVPGLQIKEGGHGGSNDNDVDNCATPATASVSTSAD